MTNAEKLERIEDWFDAVIFLTASDWATEPRSNRYHYATRFARRVPVYFVQPDQSFRGLFDEDSGTPNLTLVHCSWDLHYPLQSPPPSALAYEACKGARKASTPVKALQAYFAAHGIRRPLIWIYNFHYEDFIATCFEDLKIFHATEDYTLGSDTLRFFDDRYRDMVLRNLRQCDLVVAVSEAVRQNYLTASGFDGVSITLPNGCDYDFWIDSAAKDFRPAASPAALVDTHPDSALKVALYQGAINERLDFDLLEQVALDMPDWTFWFCGRESMDPTSDEAAAWARLLARPNVRYWGNLKSEQVAALARSATVGLAPYKANRFVYVALPLKAYEYVACGLPVVTAPVAALEAEPANFRTARTAAEWMAAIRELGPTRQDPVALARRLQSAKAMDYALRFSDLEQVIIEMVRARLSEDKVLNLVVLHDDAVEDAAGIRQELNQLQEQSRHRYFFCPIPHGEQRSEIDHAAGAPDLMFFDAVVVWGSPGLLRSPPSALVGGILRKHKGLTVLVAPSGEAAQAAGLVTDLVAVRDPGDAAGFIERLGGALAKNVLKGSRADVLTGPVAYRPRSSGEWEIAVRRHGMDFGVSTEVLVGPTMRAVRTRALDHAGAMNQQRSRAAEPPSLVWSAVSEVRLDRVTVTNYWRRAGADLQSDPTGLRLVTPPIAWHYAAIVRFEAANSPPASHLAVDIGAVEGEVAISLFDEETDTVHAERIVKGAAGGLVILEARAPMLALLFRSGSLDLSATTVIRRIQWVNLDL